MKKYIFFVLLIFPLSFLFCDDISDIIKNTQTNVSLENANALNIYTSVSMDIKDDWSYEYKVFYIKKILTYKGKKRYSDVKLRYFPEYETIRIDTAFTIDTQGKRINLPENMIYNLDTRDVMYSPKYIKEKEMILNFPQIEPGYYIVLKYTLTNTKRKKISGTEHLMETNPYAYKKFTISFPKDFSIHTYYPPDKDVRFSKNTIHDKTVLSWEIKDSPLIKDEPNQPSFKIIGCPVIYTFYDDWNELGKEKLIKLKPDKIPETIKTKALDITNHENSDYNKIVALYKYFAKNFDVNRAYLDEIDYTPEDLITIQQNKYGSPIDITALFLAYCKASDIKDVYPALVLQQLNSFDDIQKKYAQTGEIYDLAIYYKGNLFKPGYEYLPMGYIEIDRTNVVYGYENPVFINYVYDKKNLEKRYYEYNLKNNSNLLKVNMEVCGYKNRLLRIRFQNTTPQKMKIWFNSFLGLNNAILAEGPVFENFDELDKPLRYNYTLKLYDFIIKQKNFEYFSINKMKLDLNVSQKTREFDYIIKRTINLKDNIKITFDKKVKLIYPENKIEYSFNANSINAYFKYSIKQEGKNLVIHRELYIPSGKISKENYKRFRNFVKAVKKPLNNMIFIKR